MKKYLSLLLAALSVACSTTAPQTTHEATGLPEIGVSGAMLNAQYWIDLNRSNAKQRMDSEQIAQLNQRMIISESVLINLRDIPANLPSDEIQKQITTLWQRPSTLLYDEFGKIIGDALIDQWLAARNLDALPATVTAQYGLAVKRTALRALPTDISVFRSASDHDIDRLQESTLFPGNAVIIWQQSRDRQWYFVQSHNYRAWVKQSDIAIGERETVLNYRERTPFIVVTGKRSQTTFTPELSSASEVALDMGTQLPLSASTQTVINGQHRFAHHVVDLPVRDDQGLLHIVPALLPINSDVKTSYLPFSNATLLQQSFKFLGERYGWGHRYNGRDCSGFVSDVYRSMGIQLPRNTGEQARNQSVQTRQLSAADSLAQREQWLRQAQVGDLIFIPGHVMMIIGQTESGPYVIHDTTGIGMQDAQQHYQRHHLNGVYVTPLLPLQDSHNKPTIMTITAIQTIKPNES